MKTTKKHNTQLFALAGEPPSAVFVKDRLYRLDSVLKHDFFAATTLYRADERGAAETWPPDKIVVKYCRSQGFCGIDGFHIGRLLYQHERAVHRLADPLGGIQRWAGRVRPVDGRHSERPGRTTRQDLHWAFAVEYVEGRTLDSFAAAPAEDFFDRLHGLLDKLHAAGLAYGDLNKRGNIVVTADNDPVLIDFQVSLILKPDAGWLKKRLLGRFFKALQRADIYHLYKHKYRMAPQLLRPGEEALGRRTGALIRLHRAIYNPIKALRRRFLLGRRDAGLLVSPTESLELTDHGETTCWRSRNARD